MAITRSKSRPGRTQKHDTLTEKERASNSFWEGYHRVAWHPMFRPMSHYVTARDERRFPRDGWVVVTDQGMLYASSMLPMPASDWAYLIAHCLLHLGLGHFQPKERPREWNVACDLIVARFLAEFKIFGRPPTSVSIPEIGAGQTEEVLYERFCRDGIPEHLEHFGTGGFKQPDMLWEETRRRWYRDQEPDWQQLFSAGLKQALVEAVDEAGAACGAVHPNRGPAGRAVS